MLVEYCERDNLVYWKLSVNLFLCYLCFLLKVDHYVTCSFSNGTVTQCELWQQIYTINVTVPFESWLLFIFFHGHPAFLRIPFALEFKKNIFRRLLLVSIVPYCTKLWYPCSIIWHHMFAVLLLCNSWKAGP